MSTAIPPGNPINNSSGAVISPSVSAAPTPGTTVLPTPITSDADLTRPGIDIGTLFAVVIGLVCAGYIVYLGHVITRK